MATRSAYPVHVAAELEPGLSRWVWLVKWLLAIPHYVVLCFLWAALVVTSVVALVAILFTGRYPRSIFEFNVGVLRWSWRVSYYSYGALGTDRYPPFTLHDVPDYPAHLEADYPERLSRGLALVKWILAIPHYLVLALLLGGAGWTVDQGNTVAGGLGLIAILVLVAGVLLLFTGRYPVGLYDLILGLNRWVLRVVGYVALMTDRYPPFRLDQGGADGSRAGDPEGDGDGSPLTGEHISIPIADGPPPTSTPAAVGGPAPPPTGHEVRSGWTGGRVLMVTLGSVLVLGAAGLGIAAGALALVAGSSRDADGFVTSPAQPLSSITYAITSGDVHLRTDVPSLPESLVGQTRLTTISTNGEDVFLGVARTVDVHAYLGEVGRAQLRAIRSGRPVYTVEPGEPPTPPTDEDFWLVDTAGSGRQAITWTPQSGDWTAVVMNADGSRGVAVEVTAGAELPVLRDLTVGMGVLAAVVLVGGALLVAAAIRSASRDGRPSP